MVEGWSASIHGVSPKNCWGKASLGSYPKRGGRIALCPGARRFSSSSSTTSPKRRRSQRGPGPRDRRRASKKIQHRPRGKLALCALGRGYLTPSSPALFFYGRPIEGRRCARALSWKQLTSPTQPPCCLPQERQYGLCLKVFRVTYPKHLREKLIDYPPTSYGSAQAPVETPLSSWRVPLFAFHVSWCYRLPQTYGYRESTRSQNAEISSKGVGLSWSWPS